MSQITKAMHPTHISIYQGLQTRDCLWKWQKIRIEDYRWRPLLISRFVEKRCHLQLGIRQKWIQHKTDHMEPTNEVLFFKNAYRSLSWAIFQLFVLTILICDTSMKLCFHDYTTNFLTSFINSSLPHNIIRYQNSSHSIWCSILHDMIHYYDYFTSPPA